MSEKQYFEEIKDMLETLEAQGVKVSGEFDPADPKAALSELQAQGVELTDEQLEMVSGGWGKKEEEPDTCCPKCKSTYVYVHTNMNKTPMATYIVCKSCNEWTPI